MSVKKAAAAELDDQPSECRLSSKGQAEVTVYSTAFITVVSTFTSPFLQSFMMAWIAWLPMVRGGIGVMIYAIDMCDHGLTFTRQLIFRRAVVTPGIDYRLATITHPAATPTPAPMSDKCRVIAVISWMQAEIEFYGSYDADVTIMVHIVWWICHVWVPFSQWDWFVGHRDIAQSGVLFARATAIGVALVGMSFDYKARVIRASALKAGPLIGLFMTLLSFLTRVSLVGLMGYEYVLAATRNLESKNEVVIPLYVIFSIIWGLASFLFLLGGDVVDDEDDFMFNNCHFLLVIFAKIFAGLFFSCFTCTIAFIVLGGATTSDGLSLPAFVRCDGVSAWRKIEVVLF